MAHASHAPIDGYRERIRRGLVGLLLFAAIALGASLRIADVNRKSLWLDEVWTYNDMKLPSIFDVMSELEQSEPEQAPLYYLALWGWTRVWGLSDTSIRALPLLLGLLTLPVSYYAWRPLIGRRAALWTVSLISLSSFHIDYSLDSRMYSAIWLLAMISSGAFLNGILSRSGRIPWLIAYGISTAILPMISYVGIAPIGAQVIYGIFLIWRRPERRIAVLESWTVALLAMLPLACCLPMVYRAVTNHEGILWIPPATWDRSLIDLYRLTGVYLLGYRTSELDSMGLWGLILRIIHGPCVFAAATLLILSFRNASKRSFSPAPGDAYQGATKLDESACIEVVVYLALWFLAPILGAFAYSLMFHSVWGIPRYLAGAAPALILWIAAAIGSSPRRWLASVLGLILVSANLTMIAFDRTFYTRTPWREIAQTIGDSWDSDRVTIVCLGWSDAHEIGPRYCLEHTLTRIGGSRREMRPVFFTGKQAALHGGPFVVVEQSLSTQELKRSFDSDEWRGLRDILRRDFRFDMIFSTLVFEERLTGMPSPFTPYVTKIWICAPAGLDRKGTVLQRRTGEAIRRATQAAMESSWRS